MSINKIFLPSTDELKAKLIADKDKTIKWLSKADALIGSSEAIKLANEVLQN
jgi:hypothetical protein